jgi:hypothetical protein
MARNHNYQRSNFLALNNAALAPFFEARHQFFSHFKLNQHNQQLIEDNQYLLAKLINEQNQALLLDSIPFEVQSYHTQCWGKKRHPQGNGDYFCKRSRWNCS